MVKLEVVEEVCGACVVVDGVLDDVISVCGVVDDVLEDVKILVCVWVGEFEVNVVGVPMVETTPVVDEEDVDVGSDVTSVVVVTGVVGFPGNATHTVVASDASIFSTSDLQKVVSCLDWRSDDCDRVKALHCIWQQISIASVAVTKATPISDANSDKTKVLGR